MEAGVAKSSQVQIFKDVIEEFKKDEPCDQTIKACMSALSLDYQEDEFTNMQKILTALSYESPSIDFKD